MSIGAALGNYFGDIWTGLRTSCVGLKITWRNMFRPAFTVLYPEVRPQVPIAHRGIHGFDEETCISCDMCAKACPVSCIYIKSVGKGEGSLMTQFDIDYTKCLFCDLCTPPCPTECIWMTQDFDLGSYSKDDCIINFARTKTGDEIAEFDVRLKKKDEEKKARAAAKKAAKAAEKVAAEAQGAADTAVAVEEPPAEEDPGES